MKMLRFCLVLCLASLSSGAGAVSLGAASSTYLTGDISKLFNLNLAWAYNWSPTPPAAVGSLEFVPMLWGAADVTSSNISNLTAGQAAGAYHELLGFNEPDQSGQANLTPAQAIALWPQLMSTGLRLGSPAPSSPYAMSQTNPTLTWLDDFMAQAKAKGYRVDFIAFHVYIDWTSPSAASVVQNWCADMYARYGKPIWITEMGTWGSGTSATPSTPLAGAYMESVLRTLDSLPYVERLGWFTDNCFSNAPCSFSSLYDGGDNLTNIGQIYKDHPTQAVPGRVQAEDYTAYYDTTAGNSGGAYRLDDVDIEASSDLGGGWDVGWIAPGEWLEYQLKVAAAGSYDFSFRVAAPSGPQSFQMQLDGASFGPIVSVPSTGGNQVWTTVVVPGLSLPAGQHALRLNFTTGGFNFNYADIAPHHDVPGRINADDFSGFYDTTTGNAGAVYGGTYREQDVDLQPCSDAGGGFDVGWTAAGEWLEYPVTVATTGSYALSLRVASGLTTTCSVQLSLDGSALGSPLSVPGTGGWQSWASVTTPAQTLVAGEHVLRLTFDTVGCNLNYIDALWAGTPTPSPSATPYAGTPTSSATPTASPSPSPTFSASPSPAPTACAVLFEGFEGGALVNPSAFNDGVSSLAYGLTTAAAVEGSHSLALSVNTVGGSWGAGMNFGSNYYDGSGIVDATGHPQLVLWMKTDQALTFTVRVREGVSTENGGDNENWVSPTLSLAGSAAWQALSLDTASFTEDMNNPACSPNCATTGNNLLDLGSMKKVEFLFAPGIANATVYVDGILFQAPGGCPSPSPSASASLTATPSPCPTPSATASAGGTATPTEAVSPTPTPSSGPSGTVTSTADPSPSLTPTPTASATTAPGLDATATAANGGSAELLQVLSAPNPQFGPRISLAVDLRGVCDGLRVSVYSKALTCVGVHRMAGTFQAGWNTVAFNAPGLAEGLYYVQVRLDGGSASHAVAAKLCILR